MDVLNILPRRIQREMLSYMDKAEELRLRAGQPPVVLLPDGERGILSLSAVTPEELWRITEAAAGGSLFSCESQLRQGFLPLPGGARLGICGTVTLENGSVRSYSEISSLCLRFPHEVIGCAEGIWGHFSDFRSTLIISPPGFGKTSLLREMVRLLSSAGYRIGLADERGEVAALYRGVPQMAVGENTDVLSGAPKAEAILCLLRSMNPQIIALDEMTREEDLNACISCQGCGVKLLATAHGEDVRDLSRRDIYRRLLDRHLFENCIVIRRDGGERIYEVTSLD